MRIKRSCATIMSLCMAFSLSAVPVAAQEHTEDCYALKEDCVHTCAEDCAEVCEHSCSEESGCLTRELICGQEHLENASALPGEGAMMEEEQNQTPEQSNEGAAAASAAADAPDAATNEPEGTAAPAGEEPQETEGVPQILMPANAGETPVSVPVLLANASADALKKALENGTDETVTLTENITIDTTLKITRKVTLDLNSFELKYENSSNNGSVIEVGSSGDLTITDSGTGGTITGGTGKSIDLYNIYGGGVYISGGGKLTLEKGSITNCKVEHSDGSSRAYGGGVYIQNGTFLMTGGSIKDCWVQGGNGDGGGVYLSGSDSTFTMKGGSITNCTISAFVGSYGGGVYANSGATFEMSGGSITGCKAQGYAGRTLGNGGGAYMGSSTTFTMSGEAYIGGNTASNIGQDVFNHGTMNANGGTIGSEKANEAQKSVYNDESAEIKGSGNESTRFNGQIQNYGKISSGEFYGEVKNTRFTPTGTIEGGEFHGEVINDGGIVNGGKFYGKVTNTKDRNNNSGEIKNGEFLGEVTNENDATTITGGSFAQIPTGADSNIRWWKVTFNWDDGQPDAIRYVINDTKVTPPTKTRAGYRFKMWRQENGWSFDPTKGIVEDMNLTAYWTAIDYKVTVTCNEGGTAMAMPRNPVYVDDEIILIATAYAGYRFKEWEVTPNNVAGIDVKADYTKFTMPADNVTIKANFEKIAYTVSVDSSEGGTATADPNTAHMDDTVKLTATPNAGYRFKNWEITPDSVTIDANDSFIMPADNVTIKANFEKIEYTVSVDNGEGGTATADPNTAHMGDTVKLTATANAGYRFKEWKVTSNNVTLNDASAANTTFTMPADNVTITALFEKLPDPTPAPSGGGGGGKTYHKMIFETNGGSTIRVINAARGDVIDLTKYSPTREGYEFIGWFADAALTQKITEIKLTDNVTVYAGWREIEPVEPETPIEPEKPEISNPFADVREENWFYDDVLFAYEQGLLRGMSANTFAPQTESTRAQIAAIFYRMEGSTAVEGGGSFADVAHGAWFYDAVTWAEQNGILSGYGNGSFGANDPVTREQLAAIFYRYAQFKGLDTENAGALDAFVDKNDASAWAHTALAWAAESGILSGKGDSRLDPKGTATRAELAAMLHRFAEQTEQ